MHTPQMGGALWGLTKEGQYALIRKVVVDHELVETNDAVINFEGNLQPTPARKLRILREGERDWNFWTLRTKRVMRNDDVFADFEGRQYRVIELEDWLDNGFGAYLVAEQPPQSAPAAAYATGGREPIKVLADALQNGLGLTDDAVVLAYEKNIIPKTNGLYVSLDYVGPAKAISSVNELDGEGNEVQSVSYSHLVQIDLLSYDASARRRKEEATMSIQSQYAQQLMEKYGISFARLPTPFIDASSKEPSKLLNRFVSTVTIFAVHRRVLAPPPLFVSFPGQITEGGPLVPFEPALLEN